jgi:hypothetical protein
MPLIQGEPIPGCGLLQSAAERCDLNRVFVILEVLGKCGIEQFS